MTRSGLLARLLPAAWLAALLVVLLVVLGALGPAGAYASGTGPAPAAEVSDSPDQPDTSEPATPTPTPTPTDTSGPTPTPTPTPDAEPTSTPTGTGQASPSASEPSPGESESSEAASPSVAPSRAGTAPAVRDSSIGAWSIALAAVVLLLAGLVLWLVYRRHEDEGSARAPAVPPPAELTLELPPVLVTDATVAVTTEPSESRTGAGIGTEDVRFLVDLGEAMIDSGAPVTHVQSVLHQVADRLGLESTQVVVLPTVLLVSLPGEATVQTAVAAAGTTKLRLDQIDAVYEVVDDATTGDLRPDDGRARLRALRASVPPRGPLVRTLGYVVLTLGLALLLGGSAADLLVAAALGLGVGSVQLLATRVPLTYTVFAPVVCSFGVALAVFLLARSVPDVDVFAPVVAPIVTFLPGALLTTSAIELATGQMISGAGRLAAGAMQLVLLAIGIVAAAQLVGVPASTLDTGVVHKLGALAPWIGVAVFGAGMVLHQCARPSSFGWILLVLYVAYAGQVIGGLFFGGVLSAFVGAVAMTPVAMFAATQRNGPPALVSFLPAFWLLVPGALGLLGVTAFISEERLEGLTTLVTTASTMIAIALGVLVGLAAGGVIGQLGRRATAHRGH